MWQLPSINYGENALIASRWDIDEHYKALGYESLEEAAQEFVDREMATATAQQRNLFARQLAEEVYTSGDALVRCWLRLVKHNQPSSAEGGDSPCT